MIGSFLFVSFVRACVCVFVCVFVCLCVCVLVHSGMDACMGVRCVIDVFMHNDIHAQKYAYIPASIHELKYLLLSC